MNGGIKEEEVVAVYVDRIERRDVGVGMGRTAGGERMGVVVELWMLVWAGWVRTWNRKEK